MIGRQGNIIYKSVVRFGLSESVAEPEARSEVDAFRIKNVILNIMNLDNTVIAKRKTS